MVKAFVGSGGKTTLIRAQARSYRQQGLTVLVTTTTHMFVEPDTLLTDSAPQIMQVLRQRGYAMAGRPVGAGKIGPLSPGTYEAVCRQADVVLVEADGSRGLPIKFPNCHEPVICPNVDEIVVVCGLHALGWPLGEVAHRPELVRACLHLTDSDHITAAHIQKLVTEGYVTPLRAAYPGMKITVHPTHDGSPAQRAIAARLAAELPVEEY